MRAKGPGAHARAQGAQAAIFGLGALLLVACGAHVTPARSAGDIVVDRAPPSPPSATLAHGPAPYEGAGWVEGHWEWDQLQFVWTDGYWIDASGASLRQPTWEPVSTGWRFVPGVLVDADGSSRPVPPPPRPAGSGIGRSSGTVIAVPPPKGPPPGSVRAGP